MAFYEHLYGLPKAQLNFVVDHVSHVLTSVLVSIYLIGTLKHGKCALNSIYTHDTRTYVLSVATATVLNDAINPYTGNIPYSLYLPYEYVYSSYM